MAAYASNTSVSSEASRNEIERILRHHGAQDFAYATSPGRAMIAFAAHNRQVRFLLPLPDSHAREFTHTPTRGTPRSPTAREEPYEHAVRQKWRALALMVKAKLEAVESGIVTFEEEFLPHIVLPNGQTVYEQTAPGIEHAYQNGTIRPLLALDP